MTYKTEELTVPFENASLFLRTIFPAEKHPDRVILLMHGVTYSSHVFDFDYKDYNFAKFLVDAGYSVWLLDLPGYARSSTCRDGLDVTIDCAAHAIEAAVHTILAKEKIEKINLLGWSMGTVTLSAFVQLAPEKVRKLILYAPILTGLGIGGKLEAYHTNTREHAAEDFRKTASGSVDPAFAEPELVAAFVDQCMAVDGKGSPNGLRVPLLSTKTLIDTKKLTIPTLLIAGSKDPYLNQTAFEAIKKETRGPLQTLLYENAAHTLIYEKPYYKAFREAVVDYLR